MAEVSQVPTIKSDNPKKGCGCFGKTLALIFLAFVLMVLLGPMTGSIKTAKELECLSFTNFITQSLNAYAKDHHGKYPQGKSSTEIFQKLLDEGYDNDPYHFCWNGWTINRPSVPYPGKLKPEDVCFDVTLPADSTSLGYLPVVFLTGYKIEYAPGGRALPLPIAGKRPWRTFMAVTYQNKIMACFPGHYMFGSDRGDYYMPGAPYRDGIDWPSYSFAEPQRGKLGAIILSDGTVINFIPMDFHANGRVYHQLTPQGEISP